jgi:long-chain acyl-CoA synthetase
MTESVGPACHLPHDAHDLEGPLTDAPPATGFPDPGVQLRIVDPADGRRLGAGEVGEILLHMPRPNPTYWSLPDGARSSFDAEGWLHTGDAGFMDERGCLHLTDRISDMIITGGENVYPAEVEAVLARIPEVADAAVFGMPDPHWGQSVWAAVIPRPGLELDGAGVIEYCRAHLAHYKCPRKVVAVSDLPRNVTGKVVRRELRARLAGSG